MEQLARGTLALFLISLIVTGGCESKDQRLADFAAKAAQQQVRQNERMAEQSHAVARQSQELAATAHTLVEKDAAARQDLLVANEKLQAQIHDERLSLDRQHERLHAERRSAIAAAAREPVIAHTIFIVGLILATLLPLAVTAYALRRLPDNSGASELIVDDVLHELFEIGASTSDRPNRVLPESERPRLAGPDELHPWSS